MRYFYSDGAMTVRELTDRMPEPRPHVNTVATIVRNLETKGFIERVEGTRPAQYRAARKAESCARNTLARVIRNFFNNSYAGAVSALVEEEKISVDELKEIIEMVERGNNGAYAETENKE